MRYRVLTNGTDFRIVVKRWWGWETQCCNWALGDCTTVPDSPTTESWGSTAEFHSVADAVAYMTKWFGETCRRDDVWRAI